MTTAAIVGTVAIFVALSAWAIDDGLHARQKEDFASLVQAGESLSEPYAKNFLDSDSSRDCENLKKGLQPLRRAIANSNGDSRAETLKVIEGWYS